MTTHLSTIKTRHRPPVFRGPHSVIPRAPSTAMSTATERQSVPLLNVNGISYAVEFATTEAKTHADYALVKKAIDAPHVSSDSLPPHFNSSKITVVDSVGSGVGRANRDIYATVLSPLFKDLAIAHDYVQTETKDHITQIAKALDLTQTNTIIMISGDTSVYEFINGLDLQQNTGSTKPIELLPLPFGTGNSISLSSGFTSEIDAIQKLFTSTTSTPLPLYRAHFPRGAQFIDTTPTPSSLLFCVVLSFAMHAKLVWFAEQPELRLLGLQRFQIAAGQVAQTPLDFNLKITTPSGPITDKSLHSYLNFFAVPLIERGYYISPNSHINEQKIHMFRIDHLPPQDLMPIMTMPYAGPGSQHTKLPSVGYESVKGEFTVEYLDDDEDKSIACIDGITVVIKDPKGKKISVSPVADAGFKINIIGMDAI